MSEAMQDEREAFEAWWTSEVVPVLRPGINFKAIAYGAWLECDNRWLAKQQPRSPECAHEWADVEQGPTWHLSRCSKCNEEQRHFYD